MNQLKKVTICIPIYNNENTISKTLDSILNQTYKNLKIKIFDNASTDRTVEIINNYVKKFDNVELFINHINIGAEANFSKCINASDGDYTAIFHADDVYMKNIIEEQVHFLNKNIHCLAVSTNAEIINQFDQITGRQFLPVELQSSEYIEFSFNELFNLVLRYGNIITCPSVMVRTNIYKNNIKEWRGATFSTAADLDVWLRISMIGKFGIINKPLMLYRLSMESYSYRIDSLCNRFNKSDLFLVLDYYILNKYFILTNESKYLYQIILFSDILNTNINKYINNRIDFKKNIELKTTFSLRIIKYKMLNIIFYTIKYFPISNKFKEYLRKIKGKK